MFPEDDLLPISALQHLLYCDRQCALIHLEQSWAESGATVHGRHLHERAHGGRTEARTGRPKVARGLAVRSLTLGVWGQTDVVEFVPAPAGVPDAPPPTPFPVEYKRGRPKAHDADRVQLCAQALCIEEMLGVAVPAGALFYGKTRRREPVPFDPAIRQLTRDTIARLHALFAAGRTPPPVYERKKCDRCSLVQLCVPRMTDRHRSAAAYLSRAIAAAAGAGPAGD